MEDDEIEYIRGQYYLRMRRLYQQALVCKERGDMTACRQLLGLYWALDDQRRDSIVWIKDRQGAPALHRN